MLYNKDQEVKQQGSGGYTTRIGRLLAGFFGICTTIRIGWEMLCLSYAGFFLAISGHNPAQNLVKVIDQFNVLTL